MKSILRFSQLLNSGPRGALRPAHLLQGLRGQETDRGFLFSEHASADRPGAGVSKEVSEKSLAQQPPDSTTGTQGVEEGEWRAPT